MGNIIVFIIGLIIILWYYNFLFFSVLFFSVFWRVMERKWERERDKNRKIFIFFRFYYYKIKLVSIFYLLGIKKSYFFF